MHNRYNPNYFEKIIYKLWEKNNTFYTKKNNKKINNFSIIMPPPNITGNLHIGHAFQQIIMDIIIRYKKMKGKNTTWIMGTDHAGIATQILVEKKINVLNKTISDKYLLSEIWKWKKKYEKKIHKQTKILGSSVDWSKIHFTLDKYFSYAVKKAFIKLYKNNLIYKTKKIVHWDKKARTVLSDLEINNKKTILKNWYIKYPLQNKKKKYLVIATTRPETILGDVALAVHPKDKRYINYINKKVINPLNNNIIQVISDDYIKPQKGTGCMKITPAHDFHDFDIAQRHKLNMINILNLNGTIKKKSDLYNYKGKKITSNTINLNNNAKLINLNTKKVRKKIIKILKKKKLLKKIEKVKSTIPYSNKTNCVIEPILTNQWYIKMSSLSLKAIDYIKQDKIIFYPNKYKKICLSWMYNIKDWCISRQIKWGHKIPIWYNKKKEIFIGLNKKDIKTKYKHIKINELKQEKSVLDTWFSSSLYSFVCLGWPKKNNNKFKNFYPISLVVSGFDIIFFWISRMIMMSLYLTKKIPFKKVFITGLIRDEKGAKMSKSIGNVIDPLDLIKGISLNELIHKRTKNLINKNNIKKIKLNTKKTFPNGIKPHGIDALRFMLASINTPNIKINLNLNILKNSYHFCNKLWNACRYIYQNIKPPKKIKIHFSSLVDQWIINKINYLIIRYKKYLYSYRTDLLCKEIFIFIKYHFCDWYIEFIKIKKNNHQVLFIIHKILKFIHPITPFITEFIWQKFTKHKLIISKNQLLSKEPFPCIIKHINKKNIKIISLIKKIIIISRKIKSKNLNKLINLYIFNIPLDIKQILYQNKCLFKISSSYINKIFLFHKIKNLTNLKKKVKINKIFFRKKKIFYHKEKYFLIFAEMVER